MGREGRRRAEERFTTDRVVDALEKAYFGVLRR